MLHNICQVLGLDEEVSGFAGGPHEAKHCLQIVIAIINLQAAGKNLFLALLRFVTSQLTALHLMALQGRHNALLFVLT